MKLPAGSLSKMIFDDFRNHSVQLNPVYTWQNIHNKYNRLLLPELWDYMELICL